MAGVFRRLQSQQLNRATIITTAQLTAELDATRLSVNIKGANKEIMTFTGELGRKPPLSRPWWHSETVPP